MVVIQPNQTNSTLGEKKDSNKMVDEVMDLSSNVHFGRRMGGVAHSYSSAGIGLPGPSYLGMPAQPDPRYRQRKPVRFPRPQATYTAPPATSQATTPPRPSTTTEDSSSEEEENVCGNKRHAMRVPCSEVTSNPEAFRIRVQNGIDVNANFDCNVTEIVCGCASRRVWVDDLTLDLNDESGCFELANQPKDGNERLVGPCQGECQPTCNQPTPVCSKLCTTTVHSYICKDGLVRDVNGFCVDPNNCVKRDTFFF